MTPRRGIAVHAHPEDAARARDLISRNLVTFGDPTKRPGLTGHIVERLGLFDSSIHFSTPAAKTVLIVPLLRDWPMPREFPRTRGAMTAEDAHVALSAVSALLEHALPPANPDDPIAGFDPTDVCADAICALHVHEQDVAESISTAGRWEVDATIDSTSADVRIMLMGDSMEDDVLVDLPHPLKGIVQSGWPIRMALGLNPASGVVEIDCAYDPGIGRTLTIRIDPVEMIRRMAGLMAAGGDGTSRDDSTDWSYNQTELPK